MELLTVQRRDQWRTWLERNHDTATDIWLVFWKKHTGRTCIAYDHSVEEALCFGWVDSLVKRIDEDRYARKFTPRRPGSKWSKINRKRALRMRAEGRMRPAGQALVDAAKASGAWDNPVSQPGIGTVPMPPELMEGLSSNPAALAFFESLSPSCRRNYKAWVGSAKRSETRVKRAAEAVRLLANGEKLGMK